MSDLPEELNFSKLPDPGDRYKLGERLGSGVYAEVYEATDRQSGGRRVAVKIQNVNAETEEDLRSEYKTLRNYSNHANLPDFYGVFLKKAPRGEDDKLWFVMELCEGGPVTDLVRGLQERNRRMTEEHIAYILKETVKALVHLHENHVMHRDVRGSNILLTKEGEVKLVDFGLSRHLKSTMDKRNTFMGSPCWMAPEIVANNAYDNRADVWALGITAIELGDAKPPFQDIHPTRALFQIVRNPPPTLYRPSNWSQNYNDFITECLEKNPEHRPFIVELIEHPFLTSLPDNDFHLSAELKVLVRDIAKIGKASRRSEVTVRKGLLKSEKSSVAETMHPEDLAAMDNISEDAILLELHERMKKGHCHTFIGDVLLILNPNEQQPIYTDSHHNKYKFKARSDNEPHIFAVADRAYQDVMHHEEPQRILLAGETLSGKTTNFMHLLDHLIFLGESGNKIGNSIKKAMSLVHAMGNAATPYNPNSTRHVLNLEVTFTPTGKASGAIFWMYQLEKWRVTTPRRGHANFHIFYYFYDAMEEAGRLKDFHLEAGRRYRYLRTEPIEGSSESSYGVREDPTGNVDKFREMETALKDLSFLDQHVESLWNILAAILILGEIRFRVGEDGKAEVVNPEIAETAAKLLQVDEKKFLWALVNYCVIEQGTAERRRHSREEAEEARDVLARGLYHRVVDWFVNAINHKMAFSRAIFGDKYSISIMDLFGFECYKKNSIEQLFVNTLNEQLQYHYNQRMFVWEMQEQEEEEIPLQTLQFYDNKPTVDELMAKPNGLLYILDEASKGSNTAEFIIGACKGPRVKPSNNTEFSVAHYTGKVCYDAREMPDKNRDFLPPEMTECMRLSGDNMIKQLFTNRFSRTGNLTLSAFDCGVDVTSKKGKWGAALVADSDCRVRKFNDEAQGQFSQTRQMRTAAAIYRSTCLEILRELAVGPGSGSTHFVRCIRADLTGQPRGFQPDVVRQQMRALAVVDTARARLKGYPHRIPFPEFIRRYKFLAFDFDENVDVTKDNSRLLLVRLKMEGWVIGKTKVFLKYYNEEYLGRTYELQVKKIVKVQTMMRAFLAKRNVASKLKNFRRNSVQQTKKKQESIKKKPVKKEDLTEDQAATLIQKQYRGYKVRKDLGPIGKGVAKMDESTLSFIREYCKKWKARSMFQVLLMYRAQKHQELVYFCQQVHLYNQLVLSDLNKCNMDVPLKSIEQGARASLVLGKHKPTVWKLPFRLDTDLPFIDTELLNDPRFGLNPFASEYDTEDWDAPLQRRPWLGKKICTKDIGVQTGTLRNEDKKNRNGDYTYIQAPFCRDPHSVSPGKLPQYPLNDRQPAGRKTPQSNLPIQHLSPQAYKKPPVYNAPADTRGGGYYNVSKEWENNNILGEDNFQRRNVSYASSHNNNNNMHGKGPHDRENNPVPSYNRNQPQAYKSTNDYNRPEPVNKRPNPIAEMQMRSQRVAGSDDNDDPPFNFQAMLRKTPTNRASLRRSNDIQYSNYDSHFNRRSSPIEEYSYRSNNVVYSSNQRSITTSPVMRSPSPRSPTPTYSRPDSKGSYYGSEYQEEDETTTAELAPGIVVQGQIADL